MPCYTDEMTEETNYFKIYHSYAPLVWQGKAPAIECGFGHGEVFPSLDKEGSENPLFKCLTCDYKVYLGLNAWQNIINAIEREKQ